MGFWPKFCDRAVTSGSLTYTPALFRPRRRGAALDADALEAMYRDHSRKLLVFFARRTMDAETATDLVAETFAAAFRDRRQFRGRTPEEAAGWIFGIARHQLASFYRRGSVEREAMKRLSVERRDLTGEELERIEELAGIAALRTRVREQLLELDAPDQEILRLRIVEERSYEEIAAVLGVNEDAVRARVSRALKRLRVLVGAEDGDLGLAA
jgi:RNA polymerase sigma-70 factor (ECF subfamily)